MTNPGLGHTLLQSLPAISGVWYVLLHGGGAVTDAAGRVLGFHTPEEVAARLKVAGYQAGDLVQMVQCHGGAVCGSGPFAMHVANALGRGSMVIGFFELVEISHGGISTPAFLKDLSNIFFRGASPGYYHLMQRDLVPEGRIFFGK